MLGWLGGIFAIIIILVFLSGGIWSRIPRRTIGIIMVVLFLALWGVNYRRTPLLAVLDTGPAPQVQDVSLPFGGLDLSSPLAAQRAGTTPSAVNVRGFDASSGRRRVSRRMGLAKYVFPELVDMVGVEQRKDYHHKDVFLHTLKVIDNICRIPPSALTERLNTLLC